MFKCWFICLSSHATVSKGENWPFYLYFSNTSYGSERAFYGHLLNNLLEIWGFFNYLIKEEGEEKESWKVRRTLALFHLFMHRWLALEYALIGDGAHDLGLSGWHANGMNCQARAENLALIIVVYMGDPKHCFSLWVLPNWEKDTTKQCTLFVSLLAKPVGR